MDIRNISCATQLAKRDISHVTIGPLVKTITININGFYVQIVRNDILQLIIGFSGKNQFCSKDCWRPS